VPFVLNSIQDSSFESQYQNLSQRSDFNVDFILEMVEEKLYSDLASFKKWDMRTPLDPAYPASSVI
jgi:hypothetical protein